MPARGVRKGYPCGRRGLARLTPSECGFRLLGEPRSGRSLRENRKYLSRSLRPGQLQRLDGSQRAQTLRRHHPPGRLSFLQQLLQSAARFNGRFAIEGLAIGRQRLLAEFFEFLDGFLTGGEVIVVEVRDEA